MRLSQSSKKLSENHMKTRALGFLLMAIGACTYAVGCGSSNNNSGTGGAGGAGTGGKGGAAGAGSGGAGIGGAAGAGTGGKTDAGTDAGTGGKTDSGTDTGSDVKVDAPADVPADAPADTQAAPTFTQVFAIISDKSTATSPGCTTCHDGVIADGGVVQLPHSMNFTDKTAAYNALVGVNSIRCAGSDAGADAGAALKRVLAGNAAQSVLWQKLNQGVNGNTMPACDNVGMPLNVPKPTDGGATDGGDAGFTLTTYAVTSGQLTTIQGWINAGAQNN